MSLSICIFVETFPSQFDPFEMGNLENEAVFDVLPNITERLYGMVLVYKVPIIICFAVLGRRLKKMLDSFEVHLRRLILPRSRVSTNCVWSTRASSIELDPVRMSST